MRRAMTAASAGLVFSALAGGGACSSRSPSEGGELTQGAGAAAAAGNGGASGSGEFAGSGGALFSLDGATGRPPDASGASGAEGCAETASAETSLTPVSLAVLFDVSGSMGKLDYPYYDPTLKWDPVVSALKTFFGDPASSGLTASLEFFPGPDKDTRCDVSSYTSPAVPMTRLPSAEFGAAIDAVAPKKSSDWRGGTPTLAAVQGTLTFLSALTLSEPSKRALVLVTDGYPQDCKDNGIDSVVAAVANVLPSISTYVIGVLNPPGGPDTVTNLQQVAVAGGTDHAFIIETGDPARTVSDFEAVVRGIRNQAISCEFEIPKVSAVPFNADRANVTYLSGPDARTLSYDAACETEFSWRYDDPATPTRMILCEATCGTVRADPHATLRVEFGCARREVIR